MSRQFMFEEDSWWQVTGPMDASGRFACTRVHPTAATVWSGQPLGERLDRSRIHARIYNLRTPQELANVASILE